MLQVDITPSLKTKLSIIAAIGPRLKDPKQHAEHFLSLFSYSVDKDAVIGVFKARAHKIQSEQFNRSSSAHVRPLLSINRKFSGRGSPRSQQGGYGERILPPQPPTSENNDKAQEETAQLPDNDEPQDTLEVQEMETEINKNENLVNYDGENNENINVKKDVD